MADMAELVLTGVPYITDNYEKVWDPAKDKTVKGFNQIKRRVQNRDGQWEEYSDYSDDDGPRSRHYSNGRRAGSRARNGDVVETRRAYRTTSTGRGDRDYRRRRKSCISIVRCARLIRTQKA